MKTGIELIAEERKRQIEKEGWTSSHDDHHTKGELAIAGACYALTPYVRGLPILNRTLIEMVWPWEREWWKPKTSNGDYKATRIRELEKAGALIAAEIDRLQRCINRSRD